MGAHLRASGMVPGDRLVLFMRNHPRYVELLFGAWWAGLVVVPVNAKLHQKEVQWIVDNAQARRAFVTADTAPDPSPLHGFGGGPFPQTHSGAGCHFSLLNAWQSQSFGMGLSRHPPHRTRFGAGQGPQGLNNRAVFGERTLWLDLL